MEEGGKVRKEIVSNDIIQIQYNSMSGTLQNQAYRLLCPRKILDYEELSSLNAGMLQANPYYEWPLCEKGDC